MIKMIFKTIQNIQTTHSNLPKNELNKLTNINNNNNNNKIDLLNEEQINQQLYGTTWNAQRVIPTPQISYMQSMFTEIKYFSSN